MTTEWIADTCDCILEIELRGATWTLIDWKKKCELHKDEADATLIATVRTHNNSYNTGFSSPPTDAELSQKSIDRRAEQTRIRGLGPGVEK